MRVVPLQKSNAVSANANRNNEQKSGGEKGEEPAAMSFRNRIDSVVSCRSTWHGGWAESVDGVCATGVSVDHEVFLAY
ncbi:hypothetical protein DQ04_04541050 [Trypanosoma grayi]|uniref:hypothetical protein n=1 Tax=Trypanosoma grayi TaxID=71804 RepID=UPI0004F3FBCC|nr:hypothetical protein DQ04_04541050 [Trypanosoma grayi]KEG09848.1 hypothetical protein DQ04_04541050 [Trypanosoma grayi]